MKPVPVQPKAPPGLGELTFGTTPVAAETESRKDTAEHPARGTPKPSRFLAAPVFACAYKSLAIATVVRLTTGLLRKYA